MSCGKPVIATNIPHSGVSWVNAHGVSGVNVTPGEATELADAIVHVVDGTNAYERYSEGALLSPKSIIQNKIIPSVAHLVCFERV